ncbi:MAG: hypothetical protein R2831_07940 [Chitinophagaceae bacterium]
MKKWIMVLIASLSIASTSQAQTFLEKLQKFAGQPDDAGIIKNGYYSISGDGELTSTDGLKQRGTIILNISNNINSLKGVGFIPEGEMKEKYVRIKNIQNFVVNGRTFEAVKTKVSSDKIGNEVILMEKLHDANDAKFKMYVMRLLSVDNMSTTVSRSYFAILPDFPMAYGLEDLKFMPFAKKMASYVEDCPELSQKIKEKVEDYKYNMFKGAANIDVFFKIMAEYNACGK